MELQAERQLAHCSSLPLRTRAVCKPAPRIHIAAFIQAARTAGVPMTKIIAASALFAAGCALLPLSRAAEDSPTLKLGDLQARSATFHGRLSVPTFEAAPAEIMRSADAAIEAGDRAFAAIGAVSPEAVTFQNTVGALDNAASDVAQATNRITILQQAHPDPAMRAAAVEALEKLQEWSVGVEYRPEVYRAVKAFAATKPDLAGEDRRLLDETLRDYKRAGLAAPEAERAEIERLRKELTRKETTFEVNINNADAPVHFSRAELEGVPPAVLARLQGEDGGYVVDVNVAFQYESVVDHAIREATRKRAYLARDNRARDPNLSLLADILRLRTDIARRLGYASWADYRIEGRMAKNGATALGFLENLKERLEPKFQGELAEFRAVKGALPGQESSEVNVWDWRFCAERVRQDRFRVDAESLRVYFPVDKVLAGMFGVYERIFGIEIREVNPPSKYADDLKAYAVLDRGTREPLGLLYMDLFPRPGKFNHFANFSLVDGKQLGDGTYLRPTTELICNFPPPEGGGPALMRHEDVVTIFHEFGHAMHAILTRAKDVRFSGTNVPTDFVEAPSQMLEYFAWDKTVLDGFAADYRDETQKVPAETLTALRAADLATKGCFYRRQLSFGILDLRLHGASATGPDLANLAGYSNAVLGEIFLPPDPATALVASWGHLVGYDAGYYGYAWADAIAADMAAVFEAAPGGYLDEGVGRRLRDEIYAQGNAREIDESIERFLGRKPSVGSFLKKMGLSSN